MTVHTIRGAFRSLNAKGNGSETFRKVFRNGSWQFFSGYLPSGTFLAGDRHASTTGDVETGEIVAQFSRSMRGGRKSSASSLDNFSLVVDAEKPLEIIPHTKPRLGVYAVTIDGETRELTNPLDRA